MAETGPRTGYVLVLRLELSDTPAVSRAVQEAVERTGLSRLVESG
jgi:hypothetical protein